jgi:hypothetical protein
LAHWIGTESLLLVCAAMVGATIVLLDRTEGDEGQPTSPNSRCSAGENQHLTMMVLLTTRRGLAFIDYEYKLVSNRSPDHLTAFFGSIMSVFRCSFRCS